MSKVTIPQGYHAPLSVYELQSTFQTPAALPAGYRSVGDWSRKEESALI